MGNVDVKGAVAVLTVIAAFVLIGTYVVRGQVPDVAVLGFCATSTGLVLGFYFGHLNGSATALAVATTQLATQALQKRTTDAAGIVPGVPAGAVPGAPGGAQAGP